ncbi:MAG: HAMP domain-containing sensor histidine kinase [Planctomycetota bacterium]
MPTALAVVAANVFTFALLLAVTEFAARADRRAIASDYSLQLVTHLDDVVDGLGRFRPAAVLDWNGWRLFDDVVVAQKPVERQEGVFDVDGVYLNPLGRAARSPGFDEQRALRMISTAVESGERIDSPFGTAVPIGIAGRPLWGGVWFNKTPVEFAELPTLTILPLFLVTLAIVTLATLVLLRRNVLDPVAELAGVARRLEAGELSARARSDERDDEIGELASSFNDMATRLERYSHDLEEAVAEATEHVRSVEAAAMTQRRLAATGELAAGIAHELNNPLGGLVNAVEALKRDDLADDRRAEYLDLVSSGLRRMGETVGRLLRLSPRDARLDTVDLARPLADALGLVRHRAERQGVELRVAGPGVRTAEPREPFADGALEPFDALPRIRGAANELGQAFLNLLVNALDAIESGDRGGQGRIVIRMSPIALDETSVAAGGVRVVVEDDGPGVDAEVLARASDAFFTTKEQGKGTGLGLAIVQNVVAAHGGRVLLTSRAGEGFRVELELPRGSEESSS